MARVKADPALNAGLALLGGIAIVADLMIDDKFSGLGVLGGIVGGIGLGRLIQIESKK